MTDFYMRPLDMKNGAVDLTHGAGGRATAQLIHDVFGRHFTNAWLDEGHDGALLPPMTRPVAVSCDGHVVRPLFFPGGDIGRYVGNERPCSPRRYEPLWFQSL